MTCALWACDDDKSTAPPVDLDAGEIVQTDASDAGAVFIPGPGNCDIVAPTACPDPAPKYADVLPIFTKQCGLCHGQDWTGEWPLDNYSHISDWQDEIRAEVASCAMPPADGGIAIPLADRMKILHWIRCGLPK